MSERNQMSKPVPAPDLETAPFWEAAARREFKLQKCKGCGAIQFPPKPRCTTCLTDELAWVALSGRGTVYSFCVMHMSLIPGFTPPYVIALVALEEQPDVRLNANILDCPIEAVHIGMPVEVTYEERTPTVIMPQFRPRGTPAAGSVGA
jgi:uncharacterized OB-fold protein